MTPTVGALGAGIAALRDVLAAAAAEGRPCLPRGGGTKDALSTPDSGARPLDVAELAGIVEYEPSEFTVTALAGTPVAQLEDVLRRHRQYLPFDPILVEAGATLGGTIAAGVSGSGRVRYGGIRDFVLGVRFLDGGGRLVHGGGKVVKNAAGFDLPKLMVGSLGSLGVMVEVTLKVFPAAEATASGRVEHSTLVDAATAVRRVLAGPCEVDALEVEAPGRLWLRVAGRSTAIAARLERALAIAGGGRALGDDEAAAHWRGRRELGWVPPGSILVKVPLQPGRIAELDRALADALGGAAPPAVYGAGGQQALVAWPARRSVDELDSLLERSGLSGLVVRGSAPRRRLGRKPSEVALERVRRALDPERRFRDP
jgi:glycolate oxidase FAD binding subunit